MSAEAFPFTDRNIVLNQQTNFSISGCSIGVSPLFNLVTERCKQGYREIVKFFSFITSDSQPIANKETNNESNGAKDNAVTIETIKQLRQAFIEVPFVLFGWDLLWRRFYMVTILQETEEENLKALWKRLAGQ